MSVDTFDDVCNSLKFAGIDLILQLPCDRISPLLFVLTEKFKDIGILISDLSDRLSSGFIRVSIGTREENEAFITGYMRIREAYDRRQLFGLAP